jgi:hypothetical protein
MFTVKEVESSGGQEDSRMMMMRRRRRRRRWRWKKEEQVLLIRAGITLVWNGNRASSYRGHWTSIVHGPYRLARSVAS